MEAIVIIIGIVVGLLFLFNKKSKERTNIENALPDFIKSEQIIDFYTHMLKDMGYSYELQRVDQCTTLEVMFKLDNGIGRISLNVGDNMNILAISEIKFDYDLDSTVAIEIWNKARNAVSIGDFTLLPIDGFIYEYSTVYSQSVYTLKEVFDIIMCHTDVMKRFSEFVAEYLSEV